jgi:hypothetical protein
MVDEVVVDITDRHSTHVVRILHDLASAGWTPSLFPSAAALLPNRQLIELREPHGAIHIRVSIFKVGDRGEPHRLDERRIEITTTFASGLSRLRNWTDVILGYDFANDVYVGLDPRRLSLGGKTHNASSSVDPSALVAAASKSHILIRPRETPSLGIEYQAIFRPQRLGEYFFNYQSIHDGLYRDDGLFSGSVRRPSHPKTWVLPSTSCHGDHLLLTNSNSTKAKKRAISSVLVEAYEIDQVASLRDLSPGELDAILRKCREVGDGGEHFVYQHERKRLHKAGRADLADKIDWVSQRAVGKGYDIKSFEIDGSPRNIEVKATIAKGATFFMSINEWKVATKMRKSYWVYRVVEALTGPRIASKLQDPVGAEAASDITRVPDGWRVTIL